MLPLMALQRSENASRSQPKPGAPVRILVADASPAYRNALSRLLQDQPIEIVGEARDTVELSLAVERLHPDVILLDPELPGVDGLQLAARVATAPGPAVIFLSLVDGAIKRRSHAVPQAAFVLKEDADAALIDQILEVGRGQAARP
jgi:chemotaxis response regulator CheB